MRSFGWVLCGLWCLLPLMGQTYPPYWDGGNGANHPPVAWPDESDWAAYTSQESAIEDKATQDPSNGGTRPQNYVNVSSGCADFDLPSIYWSYDSVNQVVFFRWRVSQQANTWATGPSPGTYSATNPWNSAQWTVMVEIDGDGFREFAIHLDGSSGAPGEEIDTLAAIWSDRPDQSIDYETEPDIFRIDLNASAFLDETTDQILNFQNSVTPVANWPNGADETDWDHGTTRATKVISPGGCTEYLIDYQIPLAMLDASSVGGPTVDENTPISFIFATANSLQNPLQKDVVLNGDFISDPTTKIPFGDVIVLSGGLVPQSIVMEISVSGCNTTALAASVRDACDVSGTTTVADVDFYYYRDTDGNGQADDGNSWTFAAQASNTGVSDWEASWDSTGLPQGLYLIGVVATDAQGNVTYSYLTQAEVDALPGNPGSTTWYANPSPDPGVLATPFANTCGTPPASLSKSVTPETTSVGGTVTYTLTVSNPTDSAITLSALADTLPSGFSFDQDSGGTLSPTTSPSNGATGAISWTFSPAVSIPAAATRTLEFDVTTSSVVGTYNNAASATTSAGTLLADPVAVGLGAPRLSLSKTADAGAYAPTDTAVFTLTYSNDSTVAIHGITLTDTLPDGLTFVSATDGGTFDGTDVSWSLGDLAAGEGPFSVSFTATVDDPYPDAAAIPLVNEATIDGTDADPVTASISVFIAAPRPDLLLQKFADAIVVTAGGSLTYTIAYLNRGNATATNVTLQDVIPAGFTYQSASPAPTTAPTVGTNGTVTWNIGSVAAGANGSVTLTVAAANPFTETSPATNTATLDSDQTGPEVGTHEVAVVTVGASCETYYFHDDTAVIGTAGSQATATTSTTNNGTAAEITIATLGSTPQTLASFYQSPVSTDGGSFSGDVTADLYLDKTGSPSADFTLTLYDFNPTTGTSTSLGSNTQRLTGNRTNQLTQFTITPSGSLSAGHHLLWVLTAVTNHASQTNTVGINYDATASPCASAVCITAPADLVVDKAVDNLLAVAGDTLVYTITFANAGGSNATGATITDTLPTGMSFVSATLNGSSATPTSNVGQVVTFSVRSDDTATAGQVTAGESGSLVITATVDQPLDAAITSLTNTASLDSSETSAIEDDITTVIQRPVLTISKTASDTLLGAGASVTYAIAVRNDGDGTATNVVVTDALPVTGVFTYDADSTDLDGVNVNPDPVAANTLTLNVGSLAVGQTKTVTYTMTVASSGLPAGQTDILNTAAVACDQTDSQTSNSVLVTLNGIPNLQLSKASSPADPWAPGDVVTYTLTVSNDGGAQATDLFISDPIPSDTTYVSGSLVVDASDQTDAHDGDGAYYDGTLNRVVFESSSLDAGTSTVVSFQVTINRPLAHGTTSIGNTASAGASNSSTKQDSTTDEVEAAALLTVSKFGPGALAFPAALAAATSSGTTLTVNDSSQLGVNSYLRVDGQTAQITAISGNTLTLDSSVNVTLNDEIAVGLVYGIHYENVGDATATNVVLTDTLPSGALFVSASGGGVHAAGEVTWSLPDLDPDDSGTVSVVVFPTATGDALNTATIDSDETTASEDDVTTSVGGLRVSKSTSTPALVNGASGTQATYQIAIENTLSTSATGIVINDPLPPGFTFASTDSLTGFSANTSPVNPTVGATDPSWGTFTLAAGATLNLEFTVDIAASVGAATYDNEVAVTSTNAEVVPFDSLGSSDEDVTITLLGDLSAEKTVALQDDADGSGSVTPGDTLRYTVVIANAGPGSVSGVTFTDTPDTNTAIVAASVTTTTGSVTGGNDGNAPITVAVGSLAAAASATITFDVTIDDPFPDGVTTISNQGVVGSTELPDVSTDDPDTVDADDPTDTTVGGALVPVLAATKDVALQDDADSSGSITPGDTLRYTVVISNSGTGPASGVTFTDTPDTNTAIVAASVTTTTGSVTGGNDGSAPITVAVGSLAAAASATITFDVTIDDPFPDGVTTISNQGVVGSTELPDVSTDDPDTVDADDPTDTTVGEALAPVLAATKDVALQDDADSSGSITPGDTLRYTVVISNSGTGAASGVTFTDTPDTNTAIVAASVTTNTGSVTGGNDGSAPITVAVGSLAAAASATITFDVTIDDPFPDGVTTVSNQGTVGSTELPDVSTDDPDTVDADDPTDSTVGEALVPVLAATKDLALQDDADSSGSITPGDTLRYTVVISNSGTGPASSVTFTDTPDTNTAIVAASVTTTTGSVTGGNDGTAPITVAVGSLAAAASATITFDVIIDDPFPDGVTTISNQGVVGSTELPDVSTDDPDTVDADDPTDTTVGEALVPVLAATKDVALQDDADSSGSTTPGDTLRYTVVISNSGTGPASGVTFTDTPDTNTAIVAASVTTTTGSVTGGNDGSAPITVDVGSLAAAASATITFDVTIDDPFPDGVTTISNQGVVGSTELPDVSTDDPDTVDADDPTDTTVGEALAPVLAATKDVALQDDADSSGSITPGDTLRYTVVISNSGTGAASGVTFTDTPDTNTAIVAASVTTTTGSVTGGNDGTAPITVAVGSLAAAASATITFDVTIDDPFPDGVTTISNQGVVGSTELPDVSTDDPDTVDADDPTDTTVGEALAPLLAATKDVALQDDADSSGSITPGDTLRYTVVISNSGTGAASGVTFTDTPDTNTAIVAASVTTNTGSVTGGNDGSAPITVDVGSLAAAASATITFDVTIDDPFPDGVTTISNQGVVGSTELPDVSTDDPDTVDADDPTDTTVGEALAPVLAATKDVALQDDADSSGSITPGDTLRYTVVISNSGTGAASGVTFTDTPDTNTAIVAASVTTTTGSVTGGNDGTAPITVNVGSLAAAASATITFDVTIDDPFPDGVTTISNQGVVGSTELPDVSTDDPDTVDADDPTDTSVGEALAPVLAATKDVALQDDADSSGSITPGDTLRYTVVISNRGTGAASSVTFTDTPDTNTAIVAASVTTNTGSVTGGNDGSAPITVDVGSLAAAASATITFDVTIDNPLPAGVVAVSNQGVVGSTELPDVSTDDPDTVDADDPTDTAVVNPAVLVATKADSLLDDADASGFPSPGDTLRYTVTLTNSGGAAATNLVFSDQPDPNTSLVSNSVTTTQGSVAATSPAILVNVGSLVGGTSVTITFDVLIDNPLAEGVVRIRNQGLVSTTELPAQTTDDPDTVQVDDPTDTPVTAEPVLDLTKVAVLSNDADANSVPSPGDTLTYTLTLVNSGNQAASGVTVSDIPDSNTALVVGSVSTSAGSVTTGNTGGDTSVVVAVGNLAGSGGSATVSYQVTINSPLPEGVSQLSNQAVVSGDGLTDEPSDDPGTASEDDPTVVSVSAEPMVAASKTDFLIVDADSNGAPSPGDTLLYTVVISNSGNGAATNLVFTDTPDSNTQLVGGTIQTSQGSITDTDPVTVALGTLAGGASATVTFRVTIDTPLPAGVVQVANQGVVTGDLPDVPTDDGDTATPDDPTVTPVDAEPVVSVTKTDSLVVDADGNGQPSPGDTLLYLLEISNTGNQAAVATVSQDTLDPHTTLEPGSVQTSQGTVTSTSPTIEVDLGTIPGGGSATVSFRAVIDNPLEAGVTQIHNQAVVTGENFPDQPSDDPDTLDPDDPTDTAVLAEPLVEVYKSAGLQQDNDANGVPSPGDVLAYSVTVVNQGNVAAGGLVFTDLITDTNLSLVVGSVQTSQGSVSVGNSGGDTHVVVVLGTLPGGGASATLSFRLTIANLVGSGVTRVLNQGWVSGDDLSNESSDDPSTLEEDDPTQVAVNADPLLDALKAVVLAVDADGNGFSSPGDTLAYTVTLTNSGNAAETQVLFRDTPDPETDIVAGSVQVSQGSVTSGNDGFAPIEANIGTLPAGQSASISFRVTINNPVGVGVTQVANQGWVSGEGTPELPTDDPGTPAEDDPTQTPVTAAPLLQVSKADQLTVDGDGDGFVSGGDTLTYSLTVTNAGNTTATNVVFSDTPDVNTTLVVGSVQTSRGSITGGNAGSPPVSVALGPLPAGESAQISFQVTINNPVPKGVSVVANQGLVTSTGLPDEPTDDPDSPGGDDETQTPVVSDPILEVSKTDSLYTDVHGDGVVSPGDVLSYQILIRNTGAATANGLVLVDTPDANTTLVVGSVSTSRGSISAGNDGNPPVTADIGSLPAGESATVTFRVTVADPFPEGVSVVANQAMLASTELPDVPSDDPDSADPNDDTETPIVLLPALEPDKAVSLLVDADANGEASAGDTLRYTVTLSNTGSAAATGVVFTDTPDANTSLVVGSVVTDTGSITSGNDGNPPVAIDLGTLAAGATAVMRFDVVVANPLPEGVTTVSNQGLVGSNEVPDEPTDDPDTGTQEDETVTVLASAPELSLSKAVALADDVDGNGLVSPGDVLAYTLTLINSGGPAGEVVVTDVPDPNTTLIVGSVTTDTGSVTGGNAGTPPVTVDIPVFAAGATASISFLVQINDPFPEGVSSVSNQAIATGNNVTDVESDDPDTGAPDDPTVTTVEVELALAARKTASLELDADGNGLVSPGDQLLYIIEVENVGEATVTAVSFSDTPGEGSQIVAGTVTTDTGTITGGNDGNPPVTADLGDLAPGDLATVSFSVSIDDPFPDHLSAVSNQGVVQSPDLPDVPTDDPETVDTDDPTVTVVSTRPLLSATKTDSLAIDADSNGIPSPGDTLLYTVVIRNDGQGAASKVVFSDTPDVYSTLVPASITTTLGSVTGGNDGNPPVTVAIGLLPADAQVTVTFQVLINDPLPANLPYLVNQGQINSDAYPVVLTDDPDVPGFQDPTLTPLGSSAVLSATKTYELLLDPDVNQAASPGDTLRYTVQIFNTGNANAHNLIFVDFPDAYTTLVPDSVTTDSGSIVHGQDGQAPVRIEIPLLAGGGVVTLSFDVLIGLVPPETTHLVNQGLVVSDSYPGVLTDDPTVDGEQDPTVTPLLLTPSLHASKTDVLYEDVDGNGSVSPGDILQYQVVVTNSGFGTAEQVVFTDTPDANTTLVPGSVQTDTGTVTGGNAGTPPVVVELGDLLPGARATLSFRVTLADPMPVGVTVVANQGTISSENQDDVLTDDPDVPGSEDPTETPVEAAPVLEAYKADYLFEDANGDLVPSPGDTILYQIVLINSGNTAATDVVMTDTPDVNTTVVPGTIQTSQGTVTGGQDGVPPIGIDIGTVPGNGGTVLISFRVTINNPLPIQVSVVLNQAAFESSNHERILSSDPDGVAGSATPTLVFQSDLRLLKTAPSQPIGVNQVFTYTLAVENLGPNAAGPVTITDPLPSELRFVDATTSLGSVVYDAPSHTVTGTLPVLAVGEVATLTLEVQLLEAVKTLVNTASVSAPQVDPALVNNSDSATILGVDEADLSISKIVLEPNTQVGHTVTYVLTALNEGPGSATGVVVTDLLPAAAQFLDAQAEVGSFDPNTGAWTIGDLASGEDVTLTLQVSYGAELAGLFIENHAVIDGDQDDPDLTDNEDDATVYVIVPVPTLTTWGLIVFGLLLGLVAMVYQRRARS